MKIIFKALKEIFDFFCGDWRVFWGVVLTLGTVILIQHLITSTYENVLSGIILISGISISLIIALKHQITH
jgi:hypothetical protein